MEINGFEFEAIWEMDCQDKWDLDFPVIQVFTRYWGRDNTAKPSIYIGERRILECSGYIQGETESETKYLAEEWIKENVSKILTRLENVSL